MKLHLRVLVMILCIMHAAPALGQSMSMSVYSPTQAFAPSISRTEIGIIGRLLNLSDADREAVITLQDGYVQALRTRSQALSEDLQDRIEHAQAMNDPALGTPSQQERNRWEADAKKLKDSFLDDLKSLLTREQADRWPLVERELRRFRDIGFGRLHGESVDLARLIEESFPAAWNNRQVVETLGNYAQVIDGALKAREETISSQAAASFEENLKSDKAEAERLYRAALAKRLAVRDINLRFTNEVAGLLSAEEGARLKQAVFDASYPHLIRQSRSETFIRAAAKLQTGNATLASDIKAVVSDYERRRLAILTDMAAVVRERDESRLPARLDPKASKTQVATTADGQTIQFMSGDSLKTDPNDPMTPLNQKRYELDRDTRKKIERMLTPEQLASVRPPAVEQMAFGFDEDAWGL